MYNSTGRQTEFILLGVVSVLLGALSLIRSQLRKKRCSAEATATITKVEERRGLRLDKSDPQRRTRYHPTLSYTVEGREYTHFCDYGFKHDKKPKEGDSMEIRYDPQDPEQIYTALESAGRTKISLFLLLFGAFLCFFFLTMKPPG